MKLAAAILFCIVAQAAAQDAGWTRYDNGRFGFSVCYPPSLLPQGESGNGDGQTFKSKDGKVTVLAFGSFELEASKGKSPFAQELDFALQTASERHFKATYRVVRPHFFVLSGASPAGRIWYRKTIEQGGRAVTVDLEYAQSARPQMDAVAAKMAACLVAGRMSY